MNFPLLPSLALALFLGATQATHAMANKEQHNIAVKVTNIKSDQGQLVLSVYDNAKHFLKQPIKIVRLSAQQVRQQGFVLSLPQGTYALTLYQDLNGNGKIDRNFIGIPSEPGGFSNNPRIFMGPPSFKSCAVVCTGDTQVSIKLR